MSGEDGAVGVLCPLLDPGLQRRHLADLALLCRSNDGAKRGTQPSEGKQDKICGVEENVLRYTIK